MNAGGGIQIVTLQFRGDLVEDFFLLILVAEPVGCRERREAFAERRIEVDRLPVVGLGIFEPAENLMNAADPKIGPGLIRIQLERFFKALEGRIIVAGKFLRDAERVVGRCEVRLHFEENFERLGGLRELPRLIQSVCKIVPRKRGLAIEHDGIFETSDGVLEVGNLLHEHAVVDPGAEVMFVALGRFLIVPLGLVGFTPGSQCVGQHHMRVGTVGREGDGLLAQLLGLGGTVLTQTLRGLAQQSMHTLIHCRDAHVQQLHIEVNGRGSSPSFHAPWLPASVMISMTTKVNKHPPVHR